MLGIFMLPEQLKLELLIRTGTLVLDIEECISRYPKLFTCNLNGEWSSGLNGVSQPAELCDEPRPAVGA